MDNLQLNAEILLISMSYSPTKGELVYAENNDGVFLNELSPYEKEIEFEEVYFDLPESVFPQNDDLPQKRPKDQLPLSSIGFQIGLRYSWPQ